MLEKLLTLLSGNMILFKTALEKSDEKLATQIEKFSGSIEEGNTKVVEEITALQSSINKLATAIEKKPAFNVEIPEIKSPAITIPEVKLPEIKVTVPEIKIPEIKLPAINVPPTQVTVEPNITVTPTPVVYPKEMTVKGVVEALKSILKALKETPAQQIYTTDNPLPVSFIDRKGGRYDLIHLGTPKSMGGQGGAPQSIEILKTSVDSTVSGVVLTPANGRRLRIYNMRFSLSADLTSVAFRFGSSSAFEKYSLPKAGGLYGASTHPDYIEGETNQSLEVIIVGTGTVTTNIAYNEFT